VLSQYPKWNRLRLRPLPVQHSNLQHHIRPLLTRPVKACTVPCCTWILRWAQAQSQGVTTLSSNVAMVFSMGLASQGSRAPIYSSGAQHQSPSNTLMTCQPYQDTVCTWSARSLSATGGTGTSAAGLTTPFQTLSFSGGGGISMQGQALYQHSAPVGR
jgi:hypothetical protein